MSRFVAINVLLGAAVLISYVHGIKTHPTQVDALWGTMPAGLQRVYQIMMLVAAAGYFPAAYSWLTHRDAGVFGAVGGPGGVGFGRDGAQIVDLLYVCVLVPSALWMPLTFAWLEHPTTALYVAMRIVLAITAFASYGLLAALLTRTPRGDLGWWLAVIGHALFTVQTGLLDPWIWPLFVRPR